MPLPGSQVIGSRWQAHHRPVAEGTMPDLCTITRAGTGAGVWDAVTETTTSAAGGLVYAGPCRVQQRMREQGEVLAGDEELGPRELLVAVPATVHAGRGDVVRITATDDPALLVGELRCDAVQQASYRFERDLLCTEV